MGKKAVKTNLRGYQEGIAKAKVLGAQKAAANEKKETQKKEKQSARLASCDAKKTAKSMAKSALKLPLTDEESTQLQIKMLKANIKSLKEKLCAEKKRNFIYAHSPGFTRQNLVSGANNQLSKKEWIASVAQKAKDRIRNSDSLSSGMKDTFLCLCSPISPDR